MGTHAIAFDERLVAPPGCSFVAIRRLLYAGVQMTTVRHESELLTPIEVAVELRTSAATVKRWLRDGRLPGVRLPGGEWRVVEDDLRALRTHQVRDHQRRDASVTAREPA